MVSIFLYIFFLIPLSFFGRWWLIMFFLMLIFFYSFSFYSFSFFYSSLSYSFGVDSLSLCLVLLSIWVVVLMILASFNVKVNNFFMEYFLLVCIFLLIFLILSFCTTSIFIFYLFFESSLIPTILLIFGWGYQPERLSAGFYLLFYTLFASLPLLVGIFYLYSLFGSMFYFYLGFVDSFFLYLSLVMAFLVKMPLLFFHFWLPSAHVEAPISGSMILAGVLLKLGGYGLMRVFFFVYPYSLDYNYVFICLSLYGMFIVGFICLAQSDIKLLIAYSSVGHMGMVICGIFSLNIWGMYGSLVLMLAHGLCSSALFCLANISYERLSSRSFYINKGLITFMPSMSMFWFLLSANNMACPPSLNLLGEVMLISSLMGWCSLSFFFLASSSFMSCCYSIYLYSYSQHGVLYSGISSCSSGNVREFILILFHFLPLNLIIVSAGLFTVWF
uniref:NADH-ubiquinone oxidoreductase chain 4 n=1 Tax=Ochterus marginatus TaxID=280162 RepID=C5HIW0_9HEMI|nr:NADH dehydrogenase subunit 4 [Ochterus marginatus]